MQANYFYFTFFEIFYPSLNWWSFIGVWVTASLLRSPELVSVFWPISTIQLFWRCRLSSNFQLFQLLFPSLGTVPSAPSAIDITVTLVFYRFLSSLARSKQLFLFPLSLLFTLWPAGTAKSQRKDLILSDGFLFVHISFRRMVKLQFLAVNYLPHPVESCLKHLYASFLH